jgi:hypothetical protein
MQPKSIATDFTFINQEILDADQHVPLFKPRI